MPLQQRPTASWTAYRQSIASRLKEVILLCLAMVRHIWSALVPWTQETWIHQDGQGSGEKIGHKEAAEDEFVHSGKV